MGNGINGELDEDRLCFDSISFFARDLRWRVVFICILPRSMESVGVTAYCIQVFLITGEAGGGSKHNAAEKTHDGPRAAGPRVNGRVGSWSVRIRRRDCNGSRGSGTLVRRRGSGKNCGFLS